MSVTVKQGGFITHLHEGKLTAWGNLGCSSKQAFQGTLKVFGFGWVILEDLRKQGFPPD